MDPITAFGLAAAIVNFIDLGSKIVTRINELSEAGDIPKVFRSTENRVFIFSRVLERTQREAANLSPQAEKKLEEILRECFDQIRQLDEILNKVKVSKGDSWYKKVVKASVSLYEEGRVHKIATSLKENVESLTLLSNTPVEKERPKVQRWPSEPPPSYRNTVGIFCYHSAVMIVLLAVRAIFSR